MPVVRSVRWRPTGTGTGTGTGACSAVPVATPLSASLVIPPAVLCADTWSAPWTLFPRARGATGTVQTFGAHEGRRTHRRRDEPGHGDTGSDGHQQLGAVPGQKGEEEAAGHAADRQAEYSVGAQVGATLDAADRKVDAEATFDDAPRVCLGRTEGVVGAELRGHRPVFGCRRRAVDRLALSWGWAPHRPTARAWRMLSYPPC